MTDLTLIIGNKNYSSWSLRPWLAMKQAGLEFVEIRIPLDTPETYQQIRRYSPSGRVPVLQHGSLLIWESLAICEYIIEHFAPQLLPRDREKRALVRAVCAEMHAGFMDLRRCLPMDCRSRLPGMGINPNVKADIARITEIWHTYRQQFGQDQPFLFGEFSLADAMFAPVVSRFVTYGVPLRKTCQAYADTIWNLPAMQDWLQAAALEVEVIAHF